MIDLRSDTVTKPTEEMRKAMYEAEVGDDVYGEDPTVRKLEETAAEVLGKEAALFVTSGTQGNQVAVLTHTRPGDEVLVEDNAHIFFYEVGAMAALAGVQTRPLSGVRGKVPTDSLEQAIRGEDIHFPPTTLICLENTHNRAGGVVIPLDYMREVKTLADRKHVSLHLDGARLFNAVVASNVSAADFASTVDSVQVCLSKGLGATAGSLLAGSRSFIERARKWRKALGGGMRQAGVLAAPGLIALTKMVDRLAEDHQNAAQLANGLAAMSMIQVDPRAVDTNIVIADVSKWLQVTGRSPSDFLASLKAKGVLATSFGGSLIRFVTHLNVSRTQIDHALQVISEVAAGR